jgi:hypothetical protein
MMEEGLPEKLGCIGDNIQVSKGAHFKGHSIGMNVRILGAPIMIFAKEKQSILDMLHAIKEGRFRISDKEMEEMDAQLKAEVQPETTMITCGLEFNYQHVDPSTMPAKGEEYRTTGL